MIGNLTCVLTKMDMLDSSLQVNLKAYTTDIWQQMNLKKTLAGEDPEWRQKMISGYTDFLNGRSKRQAEEGLIEIDEAAELEKFLEDYDEFKTDIGSMIGNLTCVLTKMDMLDSSLQVNLKAYTTDIWQ